MSSASDKLIVALDVQSEAEALRLVEELRNHVGMFKVGVELFSAGGLPLVSRLCGIGAKVFLDIKLHDIPNTVARMLRNVIRHKPPAMVNLHASGGSEMMVAAAGAAKDEAENCAVNRSLLVAVTVLTSLDQDSLNRECRVPGDIGDHVVHLAKLAETSGMDGVVASPLEVELIRRSVRSDFVVVTPGVRPQWAVAGDQKRISTPADAIRRGADYIVVGRPILSPPPEVGDPVNAAEKILEEMEGL